MPEEIKDVKKEVKPESSTGDKEPEKTPEPKKEEEEKTVPYGRFKEVNDEKNDLSRRLESLESRFEERSEKSKPDPVDESVKRLVAKGMEESNARALAEEQFELASKAVEEKIAPIQKSSAQAEIDALVTSFASKHKDYYDLEPEMYEVYRTLDPQAQNFVASSRQGLEMLYGHVKSKKLQEIVDKGYKQGVEDGYKTKRDKGAVSSESGAGSVATGIPSAKAIEDMTLDEYIKDRERILKNQHKISQE